MDQDARRLAGVIQAVRELPPYCSLGTAAGPTLVVRLTDLLRAMGLCATELAAAGKACELPPHDQDTPHCGQYARWPCTREPGDPPRLPVPPYRPVSVAEMDAIRSQYTPPAGEPNGP